MTNFFKHTALKSAIAAGLMLGAASASPAIAQNAGGTVIQGLAVAEFQAAVANSAAFKTAAQQRVVTYKPQIDQYEARGTQLQAQMKPLVDKFNIDSQVANPNTASLAQQATQIQKLQQSAEEELNNILKPVLWSQAYVEEQIGNFFDQAVQKAMQKRNISIVFERQSVFAMNPKAYDLNLDIVNELNLLIPAAQLVPPEGWEPKEIRDAKAQQAAQQSAAGGSAPTSAGPQPVGR